MPRRDDDFDSDLDDWPQPRRRPAKKKKKDATWIVILACVAVFLVLAVGGAIGGYLWLRGSGPVGPANPAAGDLERLAGQWQATYRDPAGRVYMYKIKEINGTTEVVKWYRPDGMLFRTNEVEFQLDTRGGAKVFRYFNGWATEANGMRQPFPSGEYGYTLEGDTWTEYDPAGATIVWTRKR